MGNRLERSLRGIALDYLGRREHARTELARKLALKGYDDAEIAEALDRLQSQNLQSDDRFASSFLDQRARMGNGPIKIVNELEQHGVAADLIERVLLDSSFDWRELATDLWRRKFSIPAENVAEKMRRHRFMQHRGFKYEHFKHLE